LLYGIGIFTAPLSFLTMLLGCVRSFRTLFYDGCLHTKEGALDR
jgi:hypothetical protein